MEFAFSPLRVGLLLACLAGFAILGGFTPPESHLGYENIPTKGVRAWLYCVAMFVTGAVSATVVDHWVGIMPPSSLRPLYVIAGVLLMAAFVIWYSSLLGSWAEQMDGL